MSTAITFTMAIPTQLARACWVGSLRVEFHPTTHQLLRIDLESRPPITPPTAWPNYAQATQRALQAFLASDWHTTQVWIKQLPVELPGSPFQQAVWRAIAAIPVGEVRTYGQIAAAIGRPQAVRAVGTACGANPFPLLIPCHRVVAAQGLGEYGYGQQLKRLLLVREGYSIV